jgi:hypothetical protein
LWNVKSKFIQNSNNQIEVRIEKKNNSKITVRKLKKQIGLATFFGWVPSVAGCVTSMVL